LQQGVLSELKSPPRLKVSPLPPQEDHAMPASAAQLSVVRLSLAQPGAAGCPISDRAAFRSEGGDAAAVE